MVTTIENSKHGNRAIRLISVITSDLSEKVPLLAQLITVESPIYGFSDGGYKG